MQTQDGIHCDIGLQDKQALIAPLSLRQAGKTILCVSHSAATIEHLCDRAIWLDHGEVVMEGLAGEVLDAYRASL